MDRKLQRLENDRMVILQVWLCARESAAADLHCAPPQEMNQRQTAVETLQRAQRVRQAKHTVQAKRLTAQEEQAAVQVNPLHICRFTLP